jgi:hypothetical protein
MRVLKYNATRFPPSGAPGLHPSTVGALNPEKEFL